MEDKNQVLLETEKDLRDEIKMRIKQRDAYYAQAIAFCGALLAFGLTKFGDNAMGGVVLWTVCRIVLLEIVGGKLLCA